MFKEHCINSHNKNSQEDKKCLENIKTLSSTVEEMAIDKGDVLVEEGEGNLQRAACKNYLLSFDKDFPTYNKGELFNIKASRIMITDRCPYSCTYCGVYYQKQLEKGKISQEEFNARDIGANEGGSVKNYKEAKKQYLSPEDYKFLAAVLGYYFKTNDITLTGGDPFVRSEVKEIIDSISSLGIKTTALTKGLPLFDKDGEEKITSIAGSVSRIIFSLDTLNPEKHASQNLPLSSRNAAIKALPRTLETIKKACNLGYHVDINSVIEPVSFDDLEKTKESFLSTLSIIKFALETSVKKLKFIELELNYTSGKPYIEEYFQKMFEGGFFKDFNVEHWEKPILNLAKTTINFCSIKKENGELLNLNTYRTHCPTTILKNNGEKNCNLSSTGELNINSVGEIVTCQKRPFLSNFNLRKAVIDRDIKMVIECIKKAETESEKQVCPEFKNQNISTKNVH